MRNVPHQINNLSRLRSALGIFQSLIGSGENAGDDGVVGQAMALGGVYQFRDKSVTTERSLELESEKELGSQGTRTFARDLRRLFLLFGMLEEVPGFGLDLTPRARHLLGLEEGAADESALWRTALRQLALIDALGRVSHPYRIMLRLVEEIPGIETARLALALEANDDSEEEFARIRTIAQDDNWVAVLTAAGVTAPTLRNAVKILPALARQLGDIIEDRGTNTSPNERRTNQDRDVESRPVPRGSSPRHRRVTATEIAAAPQAGDRTPDEEDYADPAVSAQMRLARLARHNRLVRKFAEVVAAAGFSLFESPYDLLGVHREHPSILAEAKTLDGTALDEVARVRGAVAQIFYYDWFNVPADRRGNGLVRVALFEQPLSEGHAAFLQSLNIVVVWQDNDRLIAPEWSANQLDSIGITLE